MSADEILLEAEMAMEKSVDYMIHEFASVRTGKASPALVENVDVQAYVVGQQTFRDHMRLNLTVVPGQAVAVPRTTTPRNLAATPSQLRQSRDAIVQRER